MRVMMVVVGALDNVEGGCDAVSQVSARERINKLAKRRLTNV